MLHVNKLWIEGYVFNFPEEKYCFFMIQKRDVHGVKISKNKISNISYRKREKHQSLLLHGKKTRYKHPKKVRALFQIFLKFNTSNKRKSTGVNR